MPPREKVVSLALQAVRLKRLFPQSTAQVTCGNELIWRAEFTPSEFSQTYLVELRCRHEGNPQVKVLRPELVAPEGESIEHTYEGKLLCLYYPKHREWRPSMVLAETVVPWISEWLLHHEIWRATGMWCGGGRHPDPARRRGDRISPGNRSWRNEGRR